MELRLSCLLNRCVVSTVGLSVLIRIELTMLVISFYSSTIFTDVGYTDEQALFASLGYGAVQVVFTIPTLFLIDRVGRRRLCLIVSSTRDNSCSLNRPDFPAHVYLPARRWSSLSQD